jgi:hypothetical protein
MACQSSMISGDERKTKSPHFIGRCRPSLNLKSHPRISSRLCKTFRASFPKQGYPVLFLVGMCRRSALPKTQYLPDEWNMGQVLWTSNRLLAFQDRFQRESHIGCLGRLSESCNCWDLPGGMGDAPLRFGCAPAPNMRLSHFTTRYRADFPPVCGTSRRNDFQSPNGRDARSPCDLQLSGMRPDV